MKKLKKIPPFKNEDSERNFWASHDVTDFFDMSLAKRASFPNLKPSSRSISLRLPEGLLNGLKTFANKKDVPYQSLMKMILTDWVEQHNRRF